MALNRRGGLGPQHTDRQGACIESSTWKTAEGPGSFPGETHAGGDPAHPFECLASGPGVISVEDWEEGPGVWVINEPIYESRPSAQRLRNGTGIPDACWMVVIRTRETNAAALAFIVPNAEDVRGPIGRYRVSIAKVEAATGLHLVDDIPEPTRTSLRDRPASSPW